MPLFTAEASNEKASVRKILELFMAKPGKDQEFCDVAKIKVVLARSQNSSACNSSIFRAAASASAALSPQHG
jgi:hypothetical protein